jgi:hypothetical protein
MTMRMTTMTTIRMAMQTRMVPRMMAPTSWHSQPRQKQQMPTQHQCQWQHQRQWQHQWQWHQYQWQY